ncbi:paxillin isoform X2 [Petromyzon marinus]|uniref:paxillin isoform X2 n=1 Tax=Petromyzon marinus TaxID=7757 RepID=UPI003F72E861
MSSSIGNNLSELDRLLQELNAAQFNSPPSPQRDCLISDGSKALAVDSSRGSAQPHSMDPRVMESQGRAATEGLQEHGSVGASVPPQQGPPSSAQMCNAVPVHQPSRMSASSATRELDELMACLSDFKIQTNFSAPSDECIPDDLSLLKTDLASTDKILSNMISTSQPKRSKLQMKGVRENSGSDVTLSAMTNGLNLKVDVPDMPSTSPNLSSRSSSPLEVLCINEEALSLDLSTSDINSSSPVNAFPLTLNKTKDIYNGHNESSVYTTQRKEIQWVAQKKAPSKQLDHKEPQKVKESNCGDVICDVQSKKSSQNELVLSLTAWELPLNSKSMDPAKPNVPYTIKTDQSSRQYFAEKTAEQGIEMLSNKILESSSIDGPGNKIHCITDSITTGNKWQQSLQESQTAAVLHISDTTVTKCLSFEQLEDKSSALAKLLNLGGSTSNIPPLSESQSSMVTQNPGPTLTGFNQISAVPSEGGANSPAKAESQIVFSEFPKMYINKNSASTGDVAVFKATDTSSLSMVTEPATALAELSQVKINEPPEKTAEIPAMSSWHSVTSNVVSSPQGTTALSVTKPRERAKVSSLPSVPLEAHSPSKMDVPHAQALKTLCTESKHVFPTPVDTINIGGEVVACLIIDGKADPTGTPGNTRKDEKENVLYDSGHEAAGDAVVIKSESFDFPPTLPPEGIKKVSASQQIKFVIKRTKETTNIHPMYNSKQPRRRMGPVIYNKSMKQDKVIQELQSRLGIFKKEGEETKKPVDEWLTEGVIVMSEPILEQKKKEMPLQRNPPGVTMFSKACSPLQTRKVLFAPAFPPPLPPTPPPPPPLPPLPPPRHQPSPPPISKAEPQLPPPPMPSEPPTPPERAYHPHLEPRSPTPPPPPPPPPRESPELAKVMLRLGHIEAPSPAEQQITAELDSLLLQLQQPLVFPATSVSRAPRASVSVGCQTDIPFDESPQARSPTQEVQFTYHEAMPAPSYSTVEKLPEIDLSDALPSPKLHSPPPPPPLIPKRQVAPPQPAPQPAPQREPQDPQPAATPPQKPPLPALPQQGSRQLDNMLGSLQSDLNRQGVPIVAKGVCAACRKPIVGQVVTAMGRTWHPEHFVCVHCQVEIGSRNFFEKDGQPYCEEDYHSLFSPRCAYCNEAVMDRVVTALDRTWHPEHFFCAQCGRPFGEEGFHERDGKPYCRQDYYGMFAPKCNGCSRAIMQNYLSALNTVWHPECFICRECFTPFINGSFFEHEGQPYCEVHYHERRGSLCSGCQKPITGRCISAMAKKFHPEHFVCAFCLKQLNKGTFKEQNDKPYCQPCFIKLFG